MTSSFYPRSDERIQPNRYVIPLSVDTSSEYTPLVINSSKKSTFSCLSKSMKLQQKIFLCFFIGTLLIIALSLVLVARQQTYGDNNFDDTHQLDDMGFDLSSRLLKPFSVEDPVNYSFYPIERSDDSKPGEILSVVKEQFRTLPTNSWCENLLLGSGVTENNHVYQIPYVVDAAGPIAGLRTHPVRAKASTREVIMIFEPNNALTLGAVEPLEQKYKVVSAGQQVLGRLVLTLEWYPPKISPSLTPYKMQCLIARGSPYMTAVYENSTPSIRAEASLIFYPIIDGQTSSMKLICGDQPGIFSPRGVRVNKHIQLRFHASDMTWMVFFSEPVDLVCSSTALEELSEIPPFFELRATQPMAKGIVRIALVNNCTTGTNPRYCEFAKPWDKEEYKKLIIDHADIYPSSTADIKLEYPQQARKSPAEDEEYLLKFNWNPQSMSGIVASDQIGGIPMTELLMLSVPHHQILMKSIIGSSNKIIASNDLCVPTLHGKACPVLGESWVVKDKLYPVSFLGDNPHPRPEMIGDLKRVLLEDIQYTLPKNYMKGAGDTYFSGKMLAKLGRILLINEGLGNVLPKSVIDDAVNRLRQNVEIWINGSAISPFLYDPAWGGLLSCGCDYDFETTLCHNEYPNCPGVGSMTMNFGFGYYNDHHFHLGYHIYAAAVVAKYDPDWGERFYERVLFLIRDIANPSPDDPFFISFRHVDWYLGFSWAGGIVQLGGQPYLNGRNWESSSEAVSAYESVALYGHAMANIFRNKARQSRRSRRLQESSQSINYEEKYESALRVKTIGRILMSLTVRAAKTYFQVQSPSSNDTVRIYPEIFTGKAVGMMWSLMMEHQTWFGNEAWKCYGIQVIPLTSVSDQRDSRAWLEEMLPQYKESCDMGQVCSEQGFSVPILTLYSKIGLWREGWEGIMNLSSSVFQAAGGNGHSRINSLWLIATWRP